MCEIQGEYKPHNKLAIRTNMPMTMNMQAVVGRAEGREDAATRAIRRLVLDGD